MPGDNKPRTGPKQEHGLARRNWSAWRRTGCWVVLLGAWSWVSGQTAGTQAAGAVASKEATSKQVLQQDLAAARQGAVDAQLRAGKSYYQGQTGRRNGAEAARWFQAASAQGSVEATAWLGACYLYGRGVSRDEQKGRELIEQAAGQGDVVGLRLLGTVWEQKQDYGKAAGFYSQAADKGDSHALIRLAHLYAHGLGMEKVDKKKAGSLLVQAAGLGDAWAELRLGRMYERGARKAGIAKNGAQAVKLYGEAAAQGNRLAAYRLGQSYSKGLGVAVPQDLKKGLQYYQQAAVQGYAPAQYEVGRIREQGLGVKVNLAAAYYWYTLAQRRGHEAATERLLGLRGKMTAEQIQKGEQMLTQHQQARPASSPGQ